MKDPNELLREIQEKRRRNLFLAFKRLFQLTLGFKWSQLKRWMFNKCVKCGASLVMYRSRNKKIKVCEHCNLINPKNIVLEQEILLNGEIVDRKVYPGRLNRYVYVLIAILVFVLLRWSIQSSKKEFKRDQRINNEQHHTYPIHEDPEFIN